MTSRPSPEEGDRAIGSNTTAYARRPEDVVAVASGVGVLVACGVVASSGEVGPVELSVFHAVNGLPDALSPLMRGSQLLGILAVGPTVALVAALLRRWRLAAAALLVTGMKLLLERVVWQVVERSRPGTTIADAIVRGDTPGSGASFVSGHVVLLSGLAWVITPYLKGRWRLVPWAIVLLVAFARVYLGAHAPVDVVGGAGLGVAIGGVTNLVVGVPDRRARVPARV